MRDWLMVRVREPPWYLAVGMEKYIRNILFFFFLLLLLSPLSRTLGTRVTYQRSVNDRKTIEIGWILFGPREGYFGGARLNRVSRDLRGCLSVSTKIGLTPHSLHHRGEKPRDTYPLLAPTTKRRAVVGWKRAAVACRRRFTVGSSIFKIRIRPN